MDWADTAIWPFGIALWGPESVLDMIVPMGGYGLVTLFSTTGDWFSARLRLRLGGFLLSNVGLWKVLEFWVLFCGMAPIGTMGLFPRVTLRTLKDFWVVSLRFSSAITRVLLIT